MKRKKEKKKRERKWTYCRIHGVINPHSCRVRMTGCKHVGSLTACLHVIYSLTVAVSIPRPRLDPVVDVTAAKPSADCSKILLY